jgi:regulator of RNase E activity RraA
MTQAPSCANIADACLRLGIPYSSVSTLRPATANCAFSGRARPVRHFGSVDLFLEAIAASQPGDILVVDNDGRHDEGCVGDLVALEAATAGIAAIVIWGRHRDTPDLASIPIAVFSLGPCPSGPRRLDPASEDRFGVALIGALAVTRGDMVVGDSDGLVILPFDRFEEARSEALAIREVEGAQAERMRGGQSLREQLDWNMYLERRSADPSLTLRQYLVERRAAIET